ncbi:MAG: hypothetical protein QJQ54_01555 [Mollicutes bacterium]|nr:MAG: hypothetical protein QJQ54_01555 [Mollicutes bacterium]
MQILDKEGYIVTDQHFMTDITGLYAIGDVVSDYIQQYTTSSVQQQLRLITLSNRVNFIRVGFLKKT